MNNKLLLVALACTVSSIRGMHQQLVAVQQQPCFAGLTTLIDQEWVGLSNDSKANANEEQARLNKVRLYLARANQKANAETMRALVNDPRSSQSEGSERTFLLASALNRFESPELFALLLQSGADANANDGFGTFAKQVEDNEQFKKQIELQKIIDRIADILLQVENGLSPAEAAIMVKGHMTEGKLDEELTFAVVNLFARAKGKEADALSNLEDALQALIMGDPYVEKSSKVRVGELQQKIRELESAKKDQSKGFSLVQVCVAAGIFGVLGYTIAKLTSSNN